MTNDPLMQHSLPKEDALAIPEGADVAHVIVEHRDDNYPLIHHGFASEDEALAWGKEHLQGEWEYGRISATLPPNPFSPS